MRDRWPQLLELVREDDGLPVRECGPWTEEKLWYWNRYLEITTTAMVGKPQWRSGVVYLDLFAGPGVCRVRESGRRLPGSSVLASRTPKRFEKIIAVELDESAADACEQRLMKWSLGSHFHVIRGDCNVMLPAVVVELPEGSLTLACLDPEGFDIRMSTLRILAEGRRVDFLLLFADAVDLVRNVDYYEQDPESKLHAAFENEEIWRPAWSALSNRSGPRVRELFAHLFAEQIKVQLGFAGVREKIIRGPRGPLYRLIYASKHERGIEFWDKVVRRDRGGQSELF